MEAKTRMICPRLSAKNRTNRTKSGQTVCSKIPPKAKSATFLAFRATREPGYLGARRGQKEQHSRLSATSGHTVRLTGQNKTRRDHGATC